MKRLAPLAFPSTTGAFGNVTHKQMFAVVWLLSLLWLKRAGAELCGYASKKNNLLTPGQMTRQKWRPCRCPHTWLSSTLIYEVCVYEQNSPNLPAWWWIASIVCVLLKTTELAQILSFQAFLPGGYTLGKCNIFPHPFFFFRLCHSCNIPHSLSCAFKQQLTIIFHSTECPKWTTWRKDFSTNGRQRYCKEYRTIHHQTPKLKCYGLYLKIYHIDFWSLFLINAPS